MENTQGEELERSSAKIIQLVITFAPQDHYVSGKIYEHIICNKFSVRKDDNMVIL